MAYPIPPQVSDLLAHHVSQNQRLVILTCGLCGSGKSTLARNIVTQHPNFTRLSIDSTIFQTYGVYGKDFNPSLIAQYQDEAEELLKAELTRLLREGKRDVVIDNAFYDKGTRDEYRELVGREGRGYEVVIFVFRVEEEELWGRIEGRQGRGNVEGGGEGMRIEREVLRGWIEGFEWPVGEGEVEVVGD